MKQVAIPAMLAVALGVTSCADMSSSTQRAVSGGAIGAAGGAAIGALAGNAGKGALIGAGAGMLGGVLVNEQSERQTAGQQSR